MNRYQDYSLQARNTFGIAARCAAFVEYASVEELRALLPELAGSLPQPLVHIGGGSNLLFTADFPGTILHSAILGKEVTREDAGSVSVRCGAAEQWDDFVEWTLAQGYYGLENLSLIPGEVGASAVQNIGAYGVEAETFIEAVETVCLTTGEARVFTHDECRYGYRSSIFKHELRGCYAVTHVMFRLSRTFVPQTSYGGLQRAVGDRKLTADELRRLVIDIRRAKLPDPAVTGSAGSFFMNPVISREAFDALQQQWPEVPHYEMADGVKVPAGWLIERCGWKGRQLGRAGVHPSQALVLINCGGATGREVVALSDAIRTDVEREFGISLTPEVQFLP